MATPCDNIELFVDGELSFEEAEAFRDHLPDCQKCPPAMDELMQLKFLGQSHVEQTAAPKPAPMARVFSLARWRQPAPVLAALAAAVLVVVAVRLVRAPASFQSDVWLAERPQRLLEARLSHPGAQRYHPPEAKMMGGEGAPEELPLGDMAVLDKSDPHGLAAAFLVRDDPQLADQALRRLEKLGASPDLDSDRAAAMLLKGQPEEALRLADAALAKAPRHPQALWNRGLALRELNLPQLAAQAFSAVHKLQEPGWSEEAQQKAEALEKAATARKERWNAAVAAGKALLEGVPEKLPEGFTEIPFSRAYFYDAVRAAPSRERVLALLPLAQQFDARAGGTVLADLVRRVAAADFQQRASLARDFAALAQGQLPPTERERFLDAVLRSKEDDLLLGTLSRLGAVARHREVFEAKAAASGDPWFQITAEHERARADIAVGNWSRATQTLLGAHRRCDAPQGIEYRCILLERELSGLYSMLHELDAARKHAEHGWALARANNEWEMERNLLWMLGEIARFVNDESLVHAFFGEILARTTDQPEVASRARVSLAAIALQKFQVDEARREMDAALATGRPLPLGGVAILADLSRLKSAPEDEKGMTGSVEALTPTLNPGERALATHLLGRFFIERDVEKGRALLRRALDEAGAPALAEDVNAQRARAYSFTSLILEAGQRKAFEETLALFARERGVESPRQCLLAATVDSERTLLITRGPTGEVRGQYDASRREPLPERLDGFVPEELLAALRGCERVDVLARPPLHGRAGLLPPELPWSYLTRTTAPVASRVGPAVHLVVSDVELPPNTSLKRLNPWTPAFGPDEQRLTLSGPEATPSRVLAAMQGATEIDLVAHGVINAYSHASYLLLAPEQEGPELQVTEVRAARLQGAPFVVLAACHAGHTAYVLHEPFSLPAAFIEAGARGVLAATVEIPDLEAAAFFNAVRERLRSGTPPAVALREERVRWLREGKGARWLDSVLLFE